MNRHKRLASPVSFMVCSQTLASVKLTQILCLVGVMYVCLGHDNVVYLLKASLCT